MTRKIETKQVSDYVKCAHPAAYYVMDEDAGGWGGHACVVHAKMFPVQEELRNG